MSTRNKIPISPLDLKSHADSIFHVLSKYKPIWTQDILHNYPNYLSAFPKNSISYLTNLPLKNLYHFDCHQDYTFIEDPGLHELFNDLQSISKIPQFIPSYQINFPQYAFTKVKHKKKHELTQLLSLFHELQQQKPMTNLLEIGGGYGHLSHLLTRFFNTPCTSLDINPELQEAGKNVFSRYESLITPHFITHEFSNSLQSDHFLEAIQTVTGIHACGNLLDTILDSCINKKTHLILTIGCCFLKMDPTKFPRSQYIKKFNLDLHSHAFTLATRGYESSNYKNFLNKYRVKQIRYTFSHLLHHQLKITDFLATGENSAKEYQKSFSSFALEKLSLLSISHNFNVDFLESYFINPHVVHEVSQMICASLFRWQFGNLLEQWITLDRALKLEESGYDVKVFQIFDKTISPRNLAIVSNLRFNFL